MSLAESDEPKDEPEDPEVPPIRNLRIVRKSTRDAVVAWDWDSQPEQLSQFLVSFKQDDGVPTRTSTKRPGIYFSELQPASLYNVEVRAQVFVSERWFDSPPDDIYFDTPPLSECSFHSAYFYATYFCKASSRPSPSYVLACTESMRLLVSALLQRVLFRTGHN